MAEPKKIEIVSPKQVSSGRIGNTKINKESVIIKVIHHSSRQLGENSSQLKIGEFIKLHYFPTSVRESFRPSWERSMMSLSNIVPTYIWKNDFSRSISFDMLFNDLGDDRKRDEVSKDGMRQGLLSVAESLQFLRDIASPQVFERQNKVFSNAPPLVGVYGLFDKEVFIGFVSSLEIEVTHWLPVGQTVSLVSRRAQSISVKKFSTFANVVSSGVGKIPVRANVSITIEEGTTFVGKVKSLLDQKGATKTKK